MTREGIEKALVRYLFTQRDDSDEYSSVVYFSKVIEALEEEGIIADVEKHEDDWTGEKLNYQAEPLEKYFYTCYCNENRDGRSSKYKFQIEFQVATYKNTNLLYVTIYSDDYDFSITNESNCLETLKLTLRRKLKKWKRKYCLEDKQSEFYAVNLYPQIYEMENYVRRYINDVFVKIFGANWWEEAIASNLRKNRKERIKDTRDYSGDFSDIDPYLYSLEVNDLLSIAQTKRYKWKPKFDERVEKVLNSLTDADLFSVLKEQCEEDIDIWKSCFGKFLPEDFSDRFHAFEKRRNQIAHNKLIDFKSYKSASTECGKLLQELKQGHKQFCENTLSKEEEEALEEYRRELEFEVEMEREAYQDIAESESGVSKLDSDEICEMYNEKLEEMYEEIISRFTNRIDLEFSDFQNIAMDEKKTLCFSILDVINKNVIDVYASLDISDEPGQNSTLHLSLVNKNDEQNYNITFTNGEYFFDEFQSCFMPLTKDELSERDLNDAMEGVYGFIQSYFIDLRKEADLHNHLAAMGKGESIVYDMVECIECGEAYICVDESIAPRGTCLNCGTKNLVLRCDKCGGYFNIEDLELKNSTFICDDCREKE